MLALADPNTYTIHLPQFEGPFDLLLFFIERDELDIHDIPISSITRDFLDYIHRLESMNIEIASEFIFVASTLMKIKAKLLLPRPTLDENGNVEDPRTELVNRLLEYKRYKEVLAQLKEMEERNQDFFKRGYTKKEEKELVSLAAPGEELIGLDLYSIMRAFQRVWERHQDRMARPKHVIRKYPYSTDQVKQDMLKRVEGKEKVDFVSFILDHPEKIYCVFSFLALLELVQQKKLKVILGKGYNNFWMTAA